MRDKIVSSNHLHIEEDIMDNPIVSTISTIDFAFYSALFVMGVVSLINAKSSRARVIHFIWTLLLVAAWITSLLSSRSVETKLFVSLLLFSTIVLNIYYKVYRSSAQHQLR
jgi:hypothetical protein